MSMIFVADRSAIPGDNVASSPHGAKWGRLAEGAAPDFASAQSGLRVLSSWWQSMRACLALFVLVTLGAVCFAGEIQERDIMHVKPNSIWFEDAVGLARWQAMKKGGNAKAFAAYQEKALRRREAWQFIYQLPAKILSYEPEKNRVHVELGEGRLSGRPWFLDVDALVR